MFMDLPVVAGALLSRALVVRTAGLAMAAGSAAYYFTHPQRVDTVLPPDLAQVARPVFIRWQKGTRLHGVWLPGQGADGKQFERTILHHHGFNSCGGVILARRPFGQRSILPEPSGNGVHPVCAWPLVREGLRRGFNFLFVDMRAHGKSEGPWDPTGNLTMTDLIAWGKWLRQAQGQLWAGVWGHSFGAAVALAVANRPGSGGFDAMVLESAPISSRGIYEGIFYPPVYRAVQPVMERLSNAQLLSLLEASRPRVPILLIHNELDRVVPRWQTDRVYELIKDHDEPDRSDYWLVPGADHLQALELVQDEYVGRTLDWFDKWM
jgi:alpha-beta hydrolase superfamily lysophospholipase